MNTESPPRRQCQLPGPLLLHTQPPPFPHASTPPRPCPRTRALAHAHWQGLLNKKPQDRLGWPALLEHPFVRETDAERQARERMLADAMEVAEGSRGWKVGG